MFDKMTKEEFIKIKTELKQIMEDAFRTMDLNEGDPSFDMQTYESDVMKKYYELELELTKKDLSSIPYREWEGIDLIIPEGKTLDFSSTKAKLDFAYLTVDGEVILHNCDIKNGDKISYNENTYSNDYKKKHPEMFLSDKFSPEIKEKFYNKSLTMDDISKLSIEEIDELKEKSDDIFGYLPYIKDLKCFSKIVKLYGQSIKDYEDIQKVVGYMYAHKMLSKLDSILSDIEDVSLIKGEIYKYLRDYLIKYDNGNLVQDFYPEDFLLANKDLFLIDTSISAEVKDKYLHRILSRKDILDNLEVFDSIIIDNFIGDKYLRNFVGSLGFGNFQKIIKKYPEAITKLPDDLVFPEWLDNSIGGLDSEDTLKSKIIVYDKYLKISHIEVSEIFVEYVKGHKFTNIDNINKIIDVIERIVKSNSLEIKRIAISLTENLINEVDFKEKFKYIENIFLESNLPMMVKIYYVFEYLHPNAKGFEYYDKMSPVLQKSEGIERNKIIYLDLLKCALGSNNRSLKEFINTLEKGSSLFSKVAVDVNLFNALSEEDIKTLKDFASSLNSLYNLSQNEFKNPRKNKDKVLDDLEELKSLFKVTKRYDLLDRVARMFASPLGIKSFDELKSLIENKTMETMEKGILNSQKPFVLESGDLLKGLNGVQYLGAILQNGSVAKEFLGYAADSDLTPLDTDVSLITSSSVVANGNYDSLMAGSYGPIWVVLKNREGRFLLTRDFESEKEVKNDFKKLELFQTDTSNVDHYGIRTGFASSEIDYIVCENKDERVHLEVARNGFYIPVVDKLSGSLLFTYEDYLDLRKKMGGLKYYGEEDYHYAKEIISEDEKKTKEEKEDLAKRVLLNEKEIEVKRKSITNYLAEVLENYGELHYGYIHDLVPGKMELINTGSTGRGTNIPGAGDFDFYLKLDDTIYSNEEKLNEIRQKLLASLPHQNPTDKPDIIDGNLRLYNVVIPGLDDKVDIDISFGVRTDKIELSTDEALKSYLDYIKKDNLDYYNLIIENILKAKMLLKENGIYKKLDKGLGGVGIENWIIQNGGSLEEACKTFVEASSKAENFTKFKDIYQIWDFGNNHYEGSGTRFNHDNFINHLNPESYQKMVEVLKSYLASLNQNSTLSNEEILVDYSKGAKL